MSRPEDPAPHPVAPGGRTPSDAVRGIGYVLIASALFAVNGSVSKTVLHGSLSSVHLVELRCLSAGVLFGVIATALRRDALATGRRELAQLAIYGIVGVAMVQWLYLVAIARMPVSISLLIEFTAPVLVTLWVRFVRHEPVRRRIWAALACTVAGLALVARVWAGLTLDGVALVAASLAAMSLAAYYLLGERRMDRRDPWSLAAWSFGIAGVFWAVVSPPWRVPYRELATVVTWGRTGMSVPAWVLVAFVVVFGTVAPFGLTLLGLRALGATRVGLIATAEPVLAGVVAWPVLGERLAAVQIVGAVVVLAGIALAETARGVHPAPVPVPETLSS